MKITIEDAQVLINKYLKNKNNLIHSRESEMVLGVLARGLGENEEVWRIAGLLHDLDWELTSSDWTQHGLKTVEILKGEGYEVPEEIAHAIASHNERNTGIYRVSKLDYALAAGESVTGLIYSYALMRPERLQGMEASSLNKKFKDKKFAANVPRESILDIEKAGLEIGEFFKIAIEAIQLIGPEVGL